MSAFLPFLLFLLTALILVWNIVLAGRIAQVRTLPRAFVSLSALAGFLVVPALVIHLATTSSITGRAILAMSWLWPVTLVLFALQALYAASRRLVNPFLGFFFAAYDVLIAADAVLRFVAANGRPLPGFALVFLAATTATFAFAAQSPLVIGSPFFFFTPMIAPAFPALRNWAGTLRIGLALVAGAWVVIFLSSLTAADQAVNSYDPHDPAVERLQERPKGDFQVGLKILEDLDGPPATLAVKYDLLLADTMGVDAVNVVMVPEQMDRAALDSLARIIDAVRVDSTLIIITLGYPSSILPLSGRSFNEAARLKTIDPLVRRLRPDVLIPAQDPFGAGTRAAGARPVEYWQGFLTQASIIAKRVRPRTKIGVSASVYDRRDSTLYAWAAAPGSPVDVMGFTLYPSPSGMRSLDAARGAADRWMQASRSSKDHWVFAVGGYPEAHGEVSQTRAVWAALAWATSRPVIKGLIVSEAGDYGVVRGLRAADGHLRGVTYKVMDAMRALRESAAPDSTPPELTTQKRVGS